MVIQEVTVCIYSSVFLFSPAQLRGKYCALLHYYGLWLLYWWRLLTQGINWPTNSDVHSWITWNYDICRFCCTSVVYPYFLILSLEMFFDVLWKFVTQIRLGPAQHLVPLRSMCFNFSKELELLLEHKLCVHICARHTQTYTHTHRAPQSDVQQWRHKRVIPDKLSFYSLIHICLVF